MLNGLSVSIPGSTTASCTGQDQEKQRQSNMVAVASGELLVGPKKVLFLDEISTGLDSSTTFQISRTLRDFCHLRDATMLVALLQPTPETYNLFDDILLMSEGKCTAQLLWHSCFIVCLARSYFCCEVIAENSDSNLQHVKVLRQQSWSTPLPDLTYVAAAVDFTSCSATSRHSASNDPCWQKDDAESNAST